MIPKAQVPKIVIRPRVPDADFEAMNTKDPNISSEVEVEDAEEESEPNDMRLPEASPGPERVVKRGRGRPRGKGKISGSLDTHNSTNTPRARGRGRGRRGRGRGATSITIRLQKRGEDDDLTSREGDGNDEETDIDAAQGDIGLDQVDSVKEVERPLGGGKPFRTILGKAYIISGDEFVTEDDPKGDEKIDQWGNLLGGRRFKANTFVLPNRHEKRMYMLAIDAARSSGFRDSLYYFRRNPLALKLNATQPEKDYLISEGKLGSHLRTRSVTLVTARSAFKLHGSKTILDGCWVIDDYYEDKVLSEITERGIKAGDPVGELPDPNAQSQVNEASNAATTRNERSTVGVSGGGPGIYRAGGPTTIFGSSGWGPFSDGPLNAVRKSLLSRDGVTEENWMWMMSTKILEAGEEWTRRRKESLLVGGGFDADGLPVSQIDANTVPASDFQGTELPLAVYEPHTNHLLYREDTQPTTARIQPHPGFNNGQVVLGGTKVGNGAWGIARVSTVMELNDLADY